MTGLLTDLGVASRLAARSLQRRLRSQSEPFPDIDIFRREMETLVAGLPGGVVKACRWLEMDARQPPWVDSGLEADVGDEFSYFIEGRTYASRALDIYVAPALQIWCKIGASGEVFRGTRANHSFQAENAGEVQFGNYFPNDWKEPDGSRKQSDAIYKTVSGRVGIMLVCWEGSALDGVKAMLQVAPNARVMNELERLTGRDTTPRGWRYLWHLGPAEIYRQGDTRDGNPCIHCATHRDVGILQYDLDLPLDASSELSWQWCVERLPSTLREDSVPSHDYLSIAVEFDNGRDITYYWSSELPVGTGYDCPLPNWHGVEYHVVVRSGQEGLGQWQGERRNLYSDYQRYMGEPPNRIVRVWLIANSIFQRREGRCDYADIVLHSRAGDLRVL